MAIFKSSAAEISIFRSSVGRKIIMAVTGTMLIAFICVHLIGNSTVWFGADAINAYAHHLHSLGPIVWIFRLAMLALFAVHIIFGIQLTLENSAATPEKNVQIKRLRTGFAAQTMIVSGLVLLAFVVYHLLHFTVQVPGMGVYEFNEATNMTNVFTMVVSGFSQAFTVLLYVVGMIFLALHLSHGFQSFFQTLGLNNDRSLPLFGAISKVFGVVVLLGYAAIPVLIICGLVK